MSTVILIRHARSVANAENILAGQTPGVRLDPTGIAQSETLIETLGKIPIAKVFVSPLQRCMDTISPWISVHGEKVEIHSESRIIEPDYGLWSGRNLAELASEPLWKDVQSNPASVQFPNGEKFIDVWHRVTSFYQSLREISDEKSNYIVVSHGDIIKFLIANILHIDFKNFQSLVVEPASISIAQISPDSERLIQFNRSHASLSETIEHLFQSVLGGEHRIPQSGKGN